MNRSYLPIIYHSDLGDEGVFCRAAVGPFQKSDEASQFCADVKAVGGRCVLQRNTAEITATAIASTIVDAKVFKFGQHFAACAATERIRRQSPSGRISKKGEPHLRRLLVLGSKAEVRYARNKPELAGWINALLARRPARATMSEGNRERRLPSLPQRGPLARNRFPHQRLLAGR
jgi:Transposase IS116/IS110/IS902 family